MNNYEKPIVYFDMDNVLVDFQSGVDKIPAEVKAEYECDAKGKTHYDDIPGIFSKMEPFKGAIEAVKKISAEYEVFILTTAPWNNPSAWSDKLEWVKKHFPKEFHKRVIISHHKDLLKGDFLIDDRGDKGQSDFEGQWIEFGSKEFPDWPTVTDYLLNDVKKLKEAHDHSFDNKSELMKSKVCGCFNCLETFNPQEIVNFIDDGKTALCPECGVDSVIGDASGYPVTNEFLYKMYRYWF